MTRIASCAEAHTLKRLAVNFSLRLNGGAEQEGWMAGAGYCSSSRIHDFRVPLKAHICEESVTSFGAEELSGVEGGVCCCVEGCWAGC